MVRSRKTGSDTRNKWSDRFAGWTACNLTLRAAAALLPNVAAQFSSVALVGGSVPPRQPSVPHVVHSKSVALPNKPPATSSMCSERPSREFVVAAKPAAHWAIEVAAVALHRTMTAAHPCHQTDTLKNCRTKQVHSPWRGVVAVRRKLDRGLVPRTLLARQCQF